MIAVIHPEEPEEAITFLYLVENDPKEKDASPLVLKSLQGTYLPKEFVKEFAVPAKSCLKTRADVGTGSPNFHIIVSTGSGTGKAKDVWTKLLEPLLGHVCDSVGEHYAVHFTSSEDSITDLVQSTLLPRANGGIAQSIVLLSGDGGVIDIVNALLSAPHSDSYKPPSLSLMPLGTGNALSSSSLPNIDKSLGLSTLLHGTPKPLPLFTATFSPGARLLMNEGRDAVSLRPVNDMPTTYGAVVLSWGLHASLVADSDTSEYRQHGSARFQMAAKENLFPSDGSAPHPYRGTVSVLRLGSTTWTPIERQEHAYVLATLVSNLESTFTISPASKPLDGKLRLIHFGLMDGKEVMEIMGAAYQGGKHVDDARVSYEAVEGIKIYFGEKEDRWRRVCIDGRIVLVEEGGWVEVRNGVGESVVDVVV
jgi:diacylglycerol kinase family enzyme